jgi:hypothetical protein
MQRMNRTALLGILSVIAYGALLAGKYVGSAPKAADTAGAVVASVPSHPATAPAVLGPTEIRPANALAPVRAGNITRTPLSAVAQNFRSAKDLKAFADSLLARRENLSREERYYLAKALETCLFATSINDDLAATSEKQRRAFLSGIPASDANAAKRIAAYDAADDTQRCLHFQGSRIAQKDIDDFYAQAALGGDPRAQARQLVAELNKNLGAPKDGLESSRAVAGDDFQRIISLLETRDPEAMVMVAQFLAQNRLIGELRIGPTGEVPEPASLVGAFSLVACDFQSSCPSFDREALQACAYAGYCSAGSYEELYENFLASPWAYSMAMRYRGIIHSAIDTRNWSLLGLQKLIGARANPAP